MNIGEEVCGEWLRHVQACEFVQYNVKTPDTHGDRGDRDQSRAAALRRLWRSGARAAVY
jgi:hypothetical protein